ncbi:hypothetical protein GDO86_017626 [Hymenochirus boettgeri]|uniref:Taste receptor type 2 n=1 Tax=Hymenochirus boettgeri TaxID=247094 RepID=A0A8T2IP94_9PIPI|nr:hypothetical protein GDO86_017626 [Hymenochirus boettgeri]
MGWGIDTILQIIGLVETIFGLIPSVFIVTSNIQCWMKGEIPNSTDHIVTALGFSGIFSAFNNAVMVFLVFSPEMPLLIYILYTVCFTSVYTFCSSCWLTTCLCFIFFMKIINFKPGFFSWIKMKIDSLVPHLILAIEGLSICLSVVYIILYPCVKDVNSTSSSMTNQTSYLLSPDYSTCVFMFGIFSIAIMVATITTGPIIVSLYKHTHRMRRNMGDGDGPSLKVYKRAACTLSSLFILYIISYSLTIAGQLSNDKTLQWIYVIFSNSFPFLQSVILILGNSRLLQKCLEILTKCRQCIYHKDGRVQTVGF